MTPESMTEQPLDDLETLIRLAGDYVHASEDLRPRVLEAGRAVSHARRYRRRLGPLAAVLFALAFSLSALGDGRSPGFLTAWLSSPSQPTTLPPATADAGWETVDSFTKLRRHQAQLLRLAL